MWSPRRHGRSTSNTGLNSLLRGRFLCGATKDSRAAANAMERLGDSGAVPRFVSRSFPRCQFPPVRLTPAGRTTSVAAQLPPPSPSFDDLVGTEEYRLWNDQPQYSRRLQVDNKLQFCRLLHGQVGRPRSFEDLVN